MRYQNNKNINKEKGTRYFRKKANLSKPFRSGQSSTPVKVVEMIGEHHNLQTIYSKLVNAFLYANYDSKILTKSSFCQ